MFSRLRDEATMNMPMKSHYSDAPKAHAAVMEAGAYGKIVLLPECD